MELYRRNNVPKWEGPYFIFRESRLFAVVIFLLLSILGVGSLCFFFRVAPLVLTVILSVVWLLLLAVIYHTTRAAFLKTNWIVQWSHSGLLIQFRSFLNYRFPDDTPTIAFVPLSEIRSVKKTAEKLKVLGLDRSPRTEYWTFLDVRTDREAILPLKEALDAEREFFGSSHGPGPMKALHYPVQVPEPGLIRIAWKSPQDHIHPRIDKALEILRYTIPVEQAPEIGLEKGKGGLFSR